MSTRYGLFRFSVSGRIFQYILLGITTAPWLAQFIKSGKLGYILRKFLGVPGRTMGALGVRPPSQAAVSFVVGPRNWSMHWDGMQICRRVNAITPGSAETIIWPIRTARGIIHFGSNGLWVDWHRHISCTNRIAVTYFHGKPEDSPEEARNVAVFRNTISRIHRVIVANTQVERRLLGWGVPRERLVRIPIGVDTKRFAVPSAEVRDAARRRFEIPKGRLVIGSLQKDGKGWGDGTEPLMSKGPDLFLDAVERLAQNFPIFVLLTGPARGYVAMGLETRGIPFAHHQLSDYFDIVVAYQALDLYLMTSREEGGPKAVIESAATGVPMVASRVGMAPDVIVDGTTGFLVEIEDTEATVERAAELLSDPALRDRIATAARANVGAYDWSRIGDAHYDQVYRPLLDLGGNREMRAT